MTVLRERTTSPPVLFLFLSRRRDLDGGLVEHLRIELEQLESAGRGHTLPVLETVGHLHVPAVRHADRHLSLVRLVLVVDHDGVGAAREAW